MSMAALKSSSLDWFYYIPIINNKNKKIIIYTDNNNNNNNKKRNDYLFHFTIYLLHHRYILNIK
jgi:hypothetical protein